MSKEKKNIFFKGELYEFPGKSELSNEFIFLHKAVSDDENRYFLQVIKVEKDRWISTDGRRMHIVQHPENDIIPEGYYQLLSTAHKKTKIIKIEFDGQYPNIDRVIPTDPPVCKTEFYGLKLKEYGYTDFYRMLYAFPEPTVININYLLDLSVIDSTWTVEWRGQKKAVVFRSGVCQAIIMPAALEE